MERMQLSTGTVPVLGLVLWLYPNLHGSMILQNGNC